ncbi:hypothetical protein R3X26_02980 [Vibrio sp. TH_r3]|uniref:hypothetical protein n=1 Tax=Vibrio sp. TH_r3 TaxID=3082084 RepID=UPI002955CC00|nr:hypothetical protein [Vibrio sp. TH_r3]MDV7103364.1 hypothetical protein [Vibrio sp. TH_r3]
MLQKDQVTLEKQLGVCLLALRVGIAVVFMAWALDKVMVPEHTARVFSAFYNISLPTNAAVGLGIAQVLFIGAFTLGLWKKVTYLAVLVLHTGSTLSAFGNYLDPFNNLLFFAAWPMLAACFTLYVLRDYDIWVLGKNKLKTQTSVA